MVTRNEIFLYDFRSARIHFLMLHWAEIVDAQLMRANDKRYSDRFNENDLEEDSCDWSELIPQIAQWNIGKQILAERNRRNEATINHERSANSALWPHHNSIGIGYDQCDALKRFLTGQFVKFFFLIDPSNASKHL